MNMVDFIKTINAIRQNPLNNFKTNNNGLKYYEENKDAIITYEDGREIEEKVNIEYMDQNPHKSSREAKMVQSGAWKPESAGWLWANLHGRRVWLAKINPEGAEAVGVGEKSTIDSNGKLHIDLQE